MHVGVYWTWELHERESTPDQIGDRLDQGLDFQHPSGKMLECYVDKYLDVCKHLNYFYNLAFYIVQLPRILS